MDKEKKESKPRAENYEKPLAVNATFNEVIKIALGKKDEVRKARQAKEQDKPLK